MAIISPSSFSAAAAEHSREPSGVLGEIRSFWRQFVVKAFNPYRPELHYMRGPGPAWRAKHLKSSRPRS